MLLKDNAFSKLSYNKGVFIMEKKLYLSSTDKKLAGVCGGVAEFFGIDSTLVRIAYAALVFCAGTGVLLYILCALIIPSKPVQ